MINHTYNSPLPFQVLAAGAALAPRGPTELAQAARLAAEAAARAEPALPGQRVTNFRPTRAFWLHVLATYGYIVR